MSTDLWGIVYATICEYEIDEPYTLANVITNCVRKHIESTPAASTEGSGDSGGGARAADAGGLKGPPPAIIYTGGTDE